MSQQLKVLLIEDNREGAAFIGRVLGQEGTSVIMEWAARFQTGLDRLSTDGLDAAIINLEQPDCQGLETLRRVRDVNQDVPIVVLNTLADVEVAAEALRQGAQEFVIKEHLSGDVLHRAIRNAIRLMDDLQAVERSKQSMRESEVRLRAILNASLDCIVTLDADGRILDFNPAAERTFGYSRDELIGQEMNQLLNSDEAGERQLRNFKKFQEKGEGSMLGTRVEALALRKDGTTFVAEMATQPVPLSGDLVFTVFLRDITERKTAEEELQRYSEDLERSNRDLEQYASIISHDLIAPLRSITGFCDLLKRNYNGKLDDRANEFITFIVDGAKRMHVLIDDLRAYSRVTTNQKPIERLDCQAVVRTAMDNLEVAIMESQATVTNDPLPVVHADKTQLIQLFQNLIANAIKYRSEYPPDIHISANKDEAKAAWVLRVRDNGIGFDPAQTNRIFEIFQRLHADEEQYPGTGIGLAICKRIVQRHHGRIRAESNPGEGSSFYFTLPIDPPAED